jgi:hypothetical protein
MIPQLPLSFKTPPVFVSTAYLFGDLGIFGTTKSLYSFLELKNPQTAKLVRKVVWE